MAGFTLVSEAKAKQSIRVGMHRGKRAGMHRGKRAGIHRRERRVRTGRRYLFETTPSKLVVA